MEAEIIPFGHWIENIHHLESIDAVRKIPKNSLVALEIKESGIRKYETVIDTLSGKEPSKSIDGTEFGEIIKSLIKVRGESVGDLRMRQSPNTWAALHLIHECKKRNFKLLPLETPTSLKRQELRSGGSTVNKTIHNALREEKMAEQAKIILREAKGRKLYILVHVSHIPHLMEELQRREVNAKVNFDSFKKSRSAMEKHLELERQKRAALKRGDEKGVIDANTAQFGIYGSELHLSDAGTEGIIGDFLAELKAKANKHAEKRGRTIKKKRADRGRTIRGIKRVFRA